MSLNKYVFDVNTIISAALIKNSTTALALDKAFASGELAVSDPILEELIEVIFRKKFDKYLSDERRLAFIARFERRIIKYEVTELINDCRDPKDNKFLELAIICNATCIITGDDDLLCLHPYKNIPIITASDFIKFY